MTYRNITKEELKIILDKHLKWLKNEDGGEMAYLRYADLSYADLSSANLSYANLSYANLRSADLSYADLSYANLRSADLRSANLRYADLRSADLRYADLSYADLRSADLRSADLLVFQYNRHTGYFTYDGHIRLGCHNFSISDWLSKYKEVGTKEEYTKLEIAVYGNFIKLCSKLQAGFDKNKALEKPKEKQSEVSA